MVGIYKITNKVNNKVYIGQSVDVKRRWRQHKSCSLKYHLYESFRKYGLNNFIFEVVTECKVSQLDELETYYIDLYDSTNPEKGYNQTIRSAGSHGIIFTYDTLQNLYEDLYDGLLTKRQLAEKYNVSVYTAWNWTSDTVEFRHRRRIAVGNVFGQLTVLSDEAVKLGKRDRPFINCKCTFISK